MKAFFTFILLSISVLTYAQFDLSGSVRNENGEPLIGASVFLVSHDYATISDEEGNWYLTDVEDGLYNLKCTYLGYKGVEIAVDVIDDEIIDIVMVGSLFEIDEIIINGVRIGADAPFAYSLYSADEISENLIVQDIPYLLQQSPSSVATSDAGNGVGYTGMRIRGSDATRVNVTINGVPLNDAESQGVFWVDLPDFGASAESIQIQRGVGTSTNGAGAFGGTVGINTNRIRVNPHAQVNVAYGSFNTYKTSLDLGTGLMNDRYAIDFKYAKIGSNGYIDRASSDLSSWYFSAAKLGESSMLKFLTFSGNEKTYQSWNGVPISKVDEDNAALLEHYNNNLSSYPTTQDSINLFDSDRRYNNYLYEDQVDHYSQSHYQLQYLKGLDNGLKINGTLHYTRGKGYFEQFRYQEDLADYNISYPLDSISGDTIRESNLVRRRWLDNHFYGAIIEVEKEIGKADFIIGGAVHNYTGDHYGQVISTEAPSSFNALDYYYENRGEKLDYNIFLKATWNAHQKIAIFGDLQYRGVNYKIEGVDNDAQSIFTDASFSFLNPKAGLTIKPSAQDELYASLAIGHREPDRNDFINGQAIEPLAEELMDYEIGWRHKASKWRAEANFYLMDYKNQLVLNGNLNDVGAALRTNVDKSYRRGIELSASIGPIASLTISPTLTLSQNKINSYTERVFDYVTGQFIDTPYSDTEISFSPSIIAANAIEYAINKDFRFSLLSKYVGKQYLDNTSSDTRSLDAYFVNDVRINYTWINNFSDRTVITLLANNITNSLYSSNGYTYSYALDGKTISEVFLYPQATFNVMLQLGVTF